VRERDGVLPERPEELRRLPGVGEYTAGAVAAFAHERPVAAVDPNVARVLERVFFGRSPRRGGPGRRARAVRDLAQDLQPRRGTLAWTFNQALMELGALVCTARAPRCANCPVKSVCRWVASASGAPRRRAPQRTAGPG